MGLAARLGARAAGAGPIKVDAMASFGREIGVGLQMLDDLGGLTLQKSRHKGHEDLRLGRLTWPWAWLAERLDRVGFQKVRGLALAVEERAEHPETLAREMRRLLGAAGEELAESHLDQALGDLTKVMGTSPLLDELAAEIDRMRASYVG